MARSRRTVLRRGLLLGSVGITGCPTGRDGARPPASDDGTSTPTEDEMSTEITFWLREVTLSEAEQDAIEPIVFSELSSGQKEIVRTALEEGEFTTTVGEESPELEGLRRLIEAQADDGVKAYLEREETFYRIGFVAGDHIIASPE